MSHSANVSSCKRRSLHFVRVLMPDLVLLIALLLVIVIIIIVMSLPRYVEHPTPLSWRVPPHTPRYPPYKITLVEWWSSMCRIMKKLSCLHITRVWWRLFVVRWWHYDPNTHSITSTSPVRRVRYSGRSKLITSVMNQRVMWPSYPCNRVALGITWPVPVPSYLPN